MSAGSSLRCVLVSGLVLVSVSALILSGCKKEELPQGIVETETNSISVPTIITNLNVESSLPPEPLAETNEVPEALREPTVEDLSPASEDAKDFAARVAEQKEVEEWFLRGLQYHEGNGTKKDTVEAKKYFEKAAEKNHPGALFNLGVYSVMGIGGETNLTKAVEYFERAADAGNEEALLNLAIHYSQGIGVAVDKAKAAEYTRRAVQLGSPEATYNLAVMYALGDGVEQDDSMAADLFLKLAEWGYSPAQANVGIYYLKGEGLEKNVKEAERWLLKAAEQGNVSAQFNLGVFYARGTGGETNLVQAYKWSTIAADLGDETAAQNRRVLLPLMSPIEIASGIREATSFKFAKIREINPTAFSQINTNLLNSAEPASKDDIEKILPTTAKPVMEDATEVKKARDQAP